MQQRIYPVNTPIPSDHDLWKQCHFCGNILPVYDLKKESELSDFTEILTKPFDQGKTVIGLDNKVKLSPAQKEKQRRLDKANKEKESDIRDAILKGNIVTIIDSTLDY